MSCRGRFATSCADVKRRVVLVDGDWGSHDAVVPLQRIGSSSVEPLVCLAPDVEWDTRHVTWIEGDQRVGVDRST